MKMTHALNVRVNVVEFFAHLKLFGRENVFHANDFTPL